MQHLIKREAQAVYAQLTAGAHVSVVCALSSLLFFAPFSSLPLLPSVPSHPPPTPSHPSHLPHPHQVYVCGGTRMGKDVKEAIADAVSAAAPMGMAKAREFVASLEKEGRYVQELWS